MLARLSPKAHPCQLAHKNEAIEFSVSAKISPRRPRHFSFLLHSNLDARIDFSAHASTQSASGNIISSRTASRYGPCKFSPIDARYVPARVNNPDNHRELQDPLRFASTSSQLLALCSPIDHHLDPSPAEYTAYATSVPAGRVLALLPIMVGKSSKAAPAERPTGRRTRNHPTASPLAHLSPVKRVRKTPKKVAKPAIDDAPAPPPQVAAAAQPATSPSQSPQPGESDSASHHVAESRSTTPPDQHANITRASRSATPHITAPKGKGKEKEAAPSPATKSRADRYASRGEPSTHQGVGPSKRTAKRTYKQAVDVSEDDEDTAGEQRRAKRTRVEHQTPLYNSPRPSTRQGAGPSEVATPQPAVTEDTETASRTFSRLDAESVGEEQPTTSSYKSPQSQAYSTPRAAGHSTENSDIDTSEQRPAATGTPNTAKTPVPSTSTQKTPTPAPEPLPIDPVERERVIEKRWGKLPQRNPESSIRNRFANLENVRESIELNESDEENGEAYTKEDHARFKKDFRLAERNMRAVMRREDPLLAPKSAMMSVTRKVSYPSTHPVLDAYISQMNRKQGSQPASEKSMNDPSPIAFTLAAGTPGTQVVTVNNPKLQETLLTIAQWADRNPGSALPSEQETVMWLDTRNQLAVSPASRTPTARKQIMQPTPKQPTLRQPTPKQPTPKQSIPRQPSPQHSRAAATPLPAEESELDDSSVHSSDSEDDGVRTPVEHREVQAAEEADTPLQQTPARHEPAPWSMFSAVKSLVSTPFTGFFGRSQHNAATITNGAASETANASRIPATPTPSAGRSFNKVKSQSERRRKGPQGFKRPVPQTERRRRVVEKQPIHLRGSEFSRADEFESQTQRARKQHRDATTAQAAEEGPSRRAHPNTFRVPSPTSSEDSDDEEVEKNGSQSTSNTPFSHVSEHTRHFSHLLLRIKEDFCHGSSVTSSSTTSNSKVSVGGSNQDPLSTDASSSSQPRELVRMDTMEFSAPHIQYIGDNRSDITGKTSLSNDSQIHWPGLETLYQSPFAKLSDEEISKAWEHVRWNEPTALRLFKEMYYKAVSCIPRNSVDLAGKLLSKKDYKVKLTRRYVFLCDYYADAFWPPYTSFADNIPSKKLALMMLQGLLDLDNKDREAAIENGQEVVQTYAQADVRGVLGLRAYDYNSKPCEYPFLCNISHILTFSSWT